MSSQINSPKYVQDQNLSVIWSAKPLIKDLVNRYGYGVLVFVEANCSFADFVDIFWTSRLELTKQALYVQ